MDIGEGGAWPVVLADYIDTALSFWHEHRSLVVPAVCAAAVLVVFLLRRPKQHEKRPASPASEEKATWLKEKDAGPSVEAGNEKTVNARKQTKPTAARVVSGRRPSPKSVGRAESGGDAIKPLILYYSLTGTTERLSKEVATKLRDLSTKTATILEPEVHDLSYIELDDYFISGPRSTPQDRSTRYFYILLIPSYDIDTIITNFLAHLDETHNDFRIDTAPLSVLAGYTVFGVGDTEGWPSEEKGLCSQAVEVDKWMAKLTQRKRAYPLGMGDVKSDLNAALEEWSSGLTTTLTDLATTGNLGEGVPGSGDPVESDIEDENDFPDNNRQKRQKRTQAADLEDVGGVKKLKTRDPIPVDFTTSSSPPSTSTTTALKPMVPPTSPTHTALTKQGYTIIGTHSGVKICRWTKSALRGRGSCYKNSFYGIASHLCMETTPSLSCSNKCVFCWRHGTNPVSTTWRWEVDPPDLIFEGAKRGHYQKIKMLRGVPGVRAERFQEAMRIRHCALSLVGEPIFYPHINEFLSLLHNEHISSFLVCNAQHPQQLKALKRVTQLYVSIDASNRESLRRIDRPLHRDFWERFNACLDILREKRFEQRTVFRLTLVKGFNVEEEVEGYAKLVEQGLPCFVEIKGVTYCGTSSAQGAGLTMANVPFWEEVVAFTEGLNAELARRGLGYGFAAEHQHSCCVLLASKRFLREGKWHTRIDYGRFFELLERERATGEGFTPEEYCAETPEWAGWGMGGFDPRDVRVDRKGRPKDVVPKEARAEEQVAEAKVEELEHEVVEDVQARKEVAVMRQAVEF